MDINELKAALEKNLQGLGCGKTTGHGYRCDQSYTCPECSALKAQARPLLDLIAENELLRKDALRYRWGCIPGNWVSGALGKFRAHENEQAITDWMNSQDAAIDAALARKPGTAQ